MESVWACVGVHVCVFVNHPLRMLIAVLASIFFKTKWKKKKNKVIQEEKNRNDLIWKTGPLTKGVCLV